MYTAYSESDIILENGMSIDFPSSCMCSSCWTHDKHVQVTRIRGLRCKNGVTKRWSKLLFYIYVLLIFNSSVDIRAEQISLLLH